MRKFLILLFLCPTITFAQFRINEASNANGSTIILPDGSSPDWIEIYNSSGTASNIGGFGLSDDRSDPMKWVVPSLTIDSLDFLTVYVNNNNSVDSIDHFETAVFAEDNWQYTIPVAEILSWKDSSFNSGAWSTGPASIGYGDGDDATALTGPITTLYYRTTFQCNNLAAINKAILDIDFDDGFVAYLNGVEIARSGLIGVPPLWDEQSADHEATLYQGGLISTFILNLATVQSALVIGSNVLAIELHNSNPGSSDLTGKPYLTFGYDQPGVFSSGTVHQYFSSGSGSNPEANFSLSTAGETIYLSDPSGFIIDSLVVTDLEPNMSNGKFPDGSQTIAVFSVPTPNASNNVSVAYDGYENQPTIVEVGGVFFGAFIIVNVTNNSVSGGELRYTTNGNNPDIYSPLLTGSVILNANCVLRVTCFPVGTNFLPSLIATETFLFQEDFALPIVSLTIDSIDLYGANGIFDNWWTDWKKPCVVEYFDKNGVKQFESRSSVRPDGGAGGSRSNPQHSVTIEPANTTFGEGKPVHYPIIPRKPYIQDYYALFIRNGSNYWNQYMQKDATFVRMMDKTNVNSQAYAPAVVFLNGQYFGIYELREKANEGYFENNYGNDRDSLDLLSVSYWYGAGILRTVKGSDSSFYTMKNLVTTIDPASPDYFTDCHEKLDLYNFADYIAGENWFGNADWIYNNMKLARARTYDNKWRFFLQDLEWGLGGWTDYNTNMFDWFRNNQQPNPYWQIYDALVQSTEFKNYFVNRFADLMNTTFQADHYQPIVDSMYTELIPDLPRHFQMWTGDPVGGMNTYNYLHTNMLDQFANRNAVVRNQIVTEYGLAEKVTVSLEVYPADAGYIKISTIVPEQLPWTGVYFDGVPVKITAIANPGYTFQSWDANATIPTGSLTQASVTYNIPTNDLFRAVFTGSTQPTALTISEINYNPDASVDGGNWIELHNFGSSPIDLTSWYVKSKLYWDKFTFDEQTLLNPGAYLVVCENMNAFNAQYPQVQNVVGGSGFVWSNKWDSVRVYNAFDSLFLSAVYTDEAPFAKCADGWGRTLENNNLLQLPLDSSNWFCGCIGGSPGEAYAPCVEPVVLSEFNYNNINLSSDGGDWIELYNNTSSSISLSGYVFKDSKNDHQYVLPSVSLAADSFLVIGNNMSLFNQKYPAVNNVVGPFDFGISPSDGIRIYDNSGVLISSFLYDTLAPWSSVPALQDFTNEYNFYSGYLDQNSGLSWFVGCEGGSPGSPFTPCDTALSVPLVSSGNGLISLYPNPATSFITIDINNSESNTGSTELIIYDVNGRKLDGRIFDIPQQSALSVDVKVEDLVQGVYYVRVLQADRSVTLPFVKL